MTHKEFVKGLLEVAQKSSSVETDLRLLARGAHLSDSERLRRAAAEINELRRALDSAIVYIDLHLVRGNMGDD